MSSTFRRSVEMEWQQPAASRISSLTLMPLVLFAFTDPSNAYKQEPGYRHSLVRATRQLANAPKAEANSRMSAIILRNINCELFLPVFRAANKNKCIRIRGSPRRKFLGEIKL